ncbi:MAG: heavy metal translocating P-type ATPase [Bacteroidota bacterium]
MECYHCGDHIIGKPITKANKNFCCNGCLTVYDILDENGLDQFYAINEKSGVKPDDAQKSKFAALDVPEIFEDFVSFQNDKIYRVTFFLPAIHCSSCIYLLEHLQKLDAKIIDSEANFTARTLTLTVEKERQLSAVAALLSSIGYRPELRKKENQRNQYDKSLLLQLGVAGFAFGSVMLWTFPEYLGIDDSFEPFRNFSAYLSLLVAIPVLVYAAQSYLKSAYHAIRTGQLNLDIPIALGILVLFTKSAVTVIQMEGAGYFDSFTGFVFFLLIGKWFQSRTYRSLSFDNDPKAYFPLGVHRVKTEQEDEIVQIDALEKENVIRVFNEEIIPCDGTLMAERAVIDTSFITGESELVTLSKGDRIYAGSKLIGTAVLIKVLSTTNQSKFASIWNQADQPTRRLIENRENLLSKYFLIGVGMLAAAASNVWAFIDPAQIVDIVTAILVVACPCALALSFPFVYGNTLRKLGRNGFYFKNSSHIQSLASIDHIVFDKTGTLTRDRLEGVQYTGSEFTSLMPAVLELARQSTHPYSKSIASYLLEKAERVAPITSFTEEKGSGISGVTENGDTIAIGNASFVGAEPTKESGSYLKINDQIMGFFSFQSELRTNILSTIKTLSSRYRLTLLSGDRETDAQLFETVAPLIDMHFSMHPDEKSTFIQHLKDKGERVLFVGDGLNDTGALETADLGVSVAEDEFRFTPKCDAIIKGKKIHVLPQFLAFGRFAERALQVCLYFSLLYNAVGISFAFMGYVTPLFAAILMPLSSITIVFLSTGLIQFKRI